MELLLQLGEVHLSLRQLAQAADAFRQVLALDSAIEAAHRGLMRVYAEQGHRTRALRQFRLCTETLARELDVEPEEETSLLCHRIAKGEMRPSGRVGPVTVFESGPLAPFVGRGPESRVVAGVLAALGRGTGAALGLVGTAGIGKTRMAQQVLQLGRQRGYRVLFGSTHQQEGRSAYAPVIEALRMALQTDAAHADLIPPELVPSIPEMVPGRTPAPGSDRRNAQIELFAAVLRYLAAEARAAPLVLILDDLHLADSGSLRLFHYLARQTPALPLVLVGTWREPDLAPELASIVGSLERQSLLRRLVLPPLSEAEHRDLLAQVLGRGEPEAKLAREIHGLCGGNPLLAKEMIRQMVASRQIALVRGRWRRTGQEALPIPPSLYALVAERQALLSPGALRLVDLAAVAGHDVTLPVLEMGFKSSGPGAPDSSSPLLNLLDEALKARLLEEQGLSYRFPHPLFREALYRQMSQARRKELHGLVGRSLERLYRDDPAMPVEPIADHYLRAGDVERAVGYLELAGDRAEAVYDHQDALRRYREALELLGEPDSTESLRRWAELHERIGDAHRAIGELAPSLAAYREALATLSQSAAPWAERSQGVLYRKIALSAILTTDMQAAADHLARARQAIGPDSLEEARLLIAEALYDWHRNALREAVARAERALEISEAAGARLEVSQACEMLALAYLPLGEWEKGLEYELRRQVTGWSPEVAVATDGHMCLWEYHLGGEEPYRQAQEFMDAVVKQATALGDLRCVAVCHYALGSMAFLRGRLEEAADQLARALALHERIGSPAGSAYTLARQATLLTAHGDGRAGWSLIQRGLEAAEQAAVRDHCLQRLYGAGIWNRLDAGDLANAGDLVRAAQEREAESATCTVCSVQLYPAVASFYLASGDFEKAGAYTEKARRLAVAGHNQGGEAEALRVEGQIHAARGEIVQAEECLQQAAAIFRTHERRYDLALTLQAWAELPVSGSRRLEPIRREAQEILQGLHNSSIPATEKRGS
jgi:tetratricopeptide (TPR) repeat protein